MKIERIYNIYFSATLTTEKVVQTISNRIKEQSGLQVINYNFAYAKNRKSFPKLKATDLVIFGMPTYAGRLPNLMLPYLDTINGRGALATIVVTFGNRNYDNSLIELRNILEAHNFHTFAGGAFSCEHSFSYELGKGRPDEEDLSNLRTFADEIYRKVKEFKVIPDPVNVYGDSEAGYYKPQDKDGNFIDIRKAKPKTKDNCTNCGLCIEICPMEAINPENPKDITGTCIKCGACYKRCPEQAKFFDDEGYLYHKKNLEEMYAGERQDNIVFI